LDIAVGTTFSLDLEALLLAPIAFALFEARLAETGDPEKTDPLAVMEAVRRHASRIDLFCQAGQISVPPRHRPVLALLEDSVHPSSALTPEHIFHPKVWCLRFKSEDGPLYRLLVLSRNLTFDRSWDVIVSVDGARVRSNADLRAQNKPLADFVRALPQLSLTRPLSEERAERISGLADELLHIRWELPDGFAWLAFHPAGIDGYKSSWPRRSDRVLVISPFLTAGQLTEIAEATSRATLVSRPESLDLIHMDLLERFESVYVLDDRDAGSEDEGAPRSDAPTREELAERPGATPTGIHAKVLVADQGWDAELRSGSTNATTAGWSGNVEFDISLFGSKNKTGVDAVLGIDRPGTNLFNMLALYDRPEPEPIAETETDKMAFRLERIGRDIARLALLARIEPDGEQHRMILSSDKPLPHAERVTIRCWPVSRHPDTAVEQIPGRPVHLNQGALSLQALTSFFVFELSAETTAGPVSTRIVCNARLEGAPEDRTERLLLEQLKTKGDVLRYLLFLLADIGDEGAFEFASILTSRSSEGERDWMPQIPLLESMLRALSRHPEALVPINRLITDLQKTPEGTALLPDGLDEIWPAVWEARSRLT
jgi:hypothetical protein